MLLSGLNRPGAAVIRGVGLALIAWSVIASNHPPGAHGRGLVVTLALTACAAAWSAWAIRPTSEQGITPDLYLLAVAGSVLIGASPNGAASAFVFVAIVVAGLRVELIRVAPFVGLAIVALSASVLVYRDSALGLLAFTLGFVASALGASNGRQARVRADQAELLLAQTQRSQEEQLRAARLEESTRLAREIHDVLAHTLAGLTIQLEATASLVEHGADRDTVLARVRRAHGLAREGLAETRRAVGALRGERVSAAQAIEALVADYQGTGGPATLVLEGDPARLGGPSGRALLRVVQEALTNARKHAPGAEVSVAISAGRAAGDELVAVVEDRPSEGGPGIAPGALAKSGGGYGLRGMRERAELLGGSLLAGPAGGGWRVELHLPDPDAPATSGAALPAGDRA